MENVRTFGLIPGARLAESAIEAARGAEALVIATEWREFAQVDFAQLKEVMAAPIIFDGRNLLDVDTMQHLGFHYRSIGRPLAAKS